MYGDEIERMAAIAAEHVNGGKFHDGDFYSPEHRERWIEAMQIATQPLYKQMSETALDALSIDSRAMDLQLLCDKQAARIAEAVELLRRVDVFITNGVELGFIRMPDANVPDPAHKTPHLVRTFLASIDASRAKVEGRSGD